MSRVPRLTLVAPEIVEAVLDGAAGADAASRLLKKTVAAPDSAWFTLKRGLRVSDARIGCAVGVAVLVRGPGGAGSA